MGLSDRQYERDDERPNYSGFGTSNWQLWSMTLWIIIVTILGTVYQMATIGARTVTLADNTGYFSFDWFEIRSGQVWRFFTYPFFGGDIISTLFALLALYTAGMLLEPRWGKTRFLMVYLITAAIAAIGATLYTWLAITGTSQTPETMLTGPWIPSLALFLVASFKYPNHPMGLLFLPITFPFKIFGLIIGGAMVLSVLLVSAFAPYSAGCLLAAGFGFILIRFPILLGFSDSVESGFHFITSLKKRYKEYKRIKALKYEAELQTEVDRILAKVKANGLHSLTEAEKRTLKRATDLQNQKPTR